jgi:hypothetical protein
VLEPGEPPDELGVSPLKDLKLLKAAKTDVAQLAAEILRAPAVHRVARGRDRIQVRVGLLRDRFR